MIKYNTVRPFVVKLSQGYFFAFEFRNKHILRFLRHPWGMQLFILCLVFWVFLLLLPLLCLIRSILAIFVELLLILLVLNYFISPLFYKLCSMWFILLTPFILPLIPIYHCSTLFIPRRWLLIFSFFTLFLNLILFHLFLLTFNHGGVFNLWLLIYQVLLCFSLFVSLLGWVFLFADSITELPKLLYFLLITTWFHDPFQKSFKFNIFLYLFNNLFTINIGNLSFLLNCCKIIDTQYFRHNIQCTNFHLSLLYFFEILKLLCFYSALSFFNIFYFFHCCWNILYMLCLEEG